MDSTPIISKALEIAYASHDGQVDLGGKPYILHPLYVASCFKDEKEIVVALLHDVLEDTNVSKEYLSKIFDDEIIKALELLTRKPGQNYFDYIEKLSHNPIAKKVKIADLLHNMDITRLDTINNQAVKRLKKYHKAWRILTSGKE